MPKSHPGRIIGYRRNGCPIREIAGGDGTANPVLARLYEQRDEQLSFVQNLTEQADSQDRGFTDSELANLNSARELVEKLNSQIEPIEQFEELKSKTNSATRSYGGGEKREHGRSPARTEPRQQYRSAGEVIVDRIRARDGDEQAAARLRDANLTLTTAGPNGEERIVHQTTDNTPGALPTPIVGNIVNDIDATRPLISSLGPKNLAAIPGKTFERPVVTQNTQAGEQTAEKTEVPSRQLVIEGVPFTKKTYGGALNVSRQDIDWTSPAVWDAIVRDLQDSYGEFSEAAVAAAFAAVPTNVAPVVATDDLKGWGAAMYAAAGQVYAGVKRLPTMIWCSIDVWEQLGPVTDQARMVFSGGGDAEGNSSLASFSGNLFKLPRIVVPDFPDGTLIVGYGPRFEVYEDRIGLLQSVEPKLFGVEIAYGGYVAFGALKAAGFAAVTPYVAPAG